MSRLLSVIDAMDETDAWALVPLDELIEARTRLEELLAVYVEEALRRGLELPRGLT
jgi:hypothetical protein